MTLPGGIQLPLARAAACVTLVSLAPVTAAFAQDRIEVAKSIRCSFPRVATASWATDGSPDAAVKPSTLVLRFEAIDADDGTALLRNGSVTSDVIVRRAGGYLHFMQSFRTGPLYTTTVFDKDGSGGRLRAVHSRHEYFPQPLDGATSSPEQYYGECEVVE